jgi:prepilin-type N-terminal cleavage/methylation domain-containing protein
MKKTAFTLIELLVVIAIIAILAAILFPVFAQAKAAAKKTAALSSVKQIGTGTAIYISDSDDAMPHVSSGGAGSINRSDYWLNIYPYVKNMDLFFSSERTELCGFTAPATSPLGVLERQVNPTGRCVGYGYNWGPQIYAGGGILQPQQFINPADTSQGTIQAGISATAMEEPANVFVFGDSYDTPRVTIGMYPNSAGGKAWILDTFPVSAATRMSAFRWAGRFNMSFADSHAKGVQFRGGLTTGVGYVFVPSQIRDRLAYCANPSAAVDGSRFGAPTNITCQDFIALPETRGTTWTN